MGGSWWNKWTKWIEGIGIILGFVALSTAIPKALDFLGYRPKSPYNWIIVGVAFVVLLIPYFVERRHAPFLRALIRAITFIPWNLILLLFGHDFQRRRLKELQLVTNKAQQSALFARIAGLRPGVSSKYYILFTHKPEDGNQNHSIGKGERYRIPGFPVDEAECIIRLWYLAASTLNLGWADIQTLCSCTWNSVQGQRLIQQGALAIVGSPKNNPCTKALMDGLRQSDKASVIERQHRFIMEMRGDLCFLNGGDTRGEFLPDSTDGRSTGDKLIDYAMVMKLPNLLPGNPSQQSPVLLLAGCKAAGQVALTDWFSEPAHLADLLSSFGEDYFQIAFKINYKYVQNGVPEIISDLEELHRERILAHPHKARVAAAHNP